MNEHHENDGLGFAIGLGCTWLLVLAVAAIVNSA